MTKPTSQPAEPTVLRFRSESGRTEIARKPDGAMSIHVLGGHDTLVGDEIAKAAWALGTGAPVITPRELSEEELAEAKARFERAMATPLRLFPVVASQDERERAAYERGKAEGIAEREQAVADALIEVDRHLGALSYIDRGGVPYVEREWAFDTVNKAAQQLFGDGWVAILRAAVDRRRATPTGGSDAA